MWIFIGGLVIFFGGLSFIFWFTNVLEKWKYGASDNFTVLSTILLMIILVGYGWWGYNYSNSLDEKGEWANTVKENTVEAYKVFLDKYQDRKFTEPGRVKLRKLLQTERNLDLQIIQSFGEVRSISLPFVEDLAEICTNLNIRNLSILIGVKGRALGKHYTKRGFLYTGASLSGKMLFKNVEGKLLKEKQFGIEISPPSSITLSEIDSGPNASSEAPFDDVYQKWVPIFSNTVGEVWEQNKEELENR